MDLFGFKVYLLLSSQQVIDCKLLEGRAYVLYL